jgi:hypothetical protein
LLPTLSALPTYASRWRILPRVSILTGFFRLWTARYLILSRSALPVYRAIPLARVLPWLPSVRVQLVKTNKVLLGFAGQIMDEDLLSIRLPDKVQKPKWARPIKAHGKASARSLTDPETTEKEADQTEIEARKQTQEDTRGSA